MRSATAVVPLPLGPFYRPRSIGSLVICTRPKRKLRKRKLKAAIMEAAFFSYRPSRAKKAESRFSLLAPSPLPFAHLALHLAILSPLPTLLFQLINTGGSARSMSTRRSSRSRASSPRARRSFTSARWVGKDERQVAIAFDRAAAAASFPLDDLRQQKKRKRTKTHPPFLFPPLSLSLSLSQPTTTTNSASPTSTRPRPSSAAPGSA